MQSTIHMIYTHFQPAWRGNGEKMSATVNINWRQVFIYITTIIMESCWIYTLLLVLNSATVDGRLSVPGIMLVFPVAVIFHKLLQSLHWHKVPFLIVSWLVWLIVLLMLVKFQLFAGTGWSQPDWLLSVPRAIGQLIYTFSPELLVFISSAVVWWLGKRLAYRGVKFAGVVTEFQFGLIALLLAFYIGYLLDVSDPHSVIIALVFFLCALLGISLAHARENTGWFSSGLNRGRWIGLLLITIALVLLLGLLVGLVISADLLHVIVAAFKWVWVWIMKALLFLASLLPSLESGELPPPDMMPAQPDTPEQYEIWKIPESVRTVLRIIWAVVFLGIVVLALWQISSQIMKWMRRRFSNMSGDEIESLRGAFREDILSLFRFIANKIRSLLRSGLRRRREAFAPETRSVRQIYRHFLRWTSSRGYPRHSAHTPYDFLGVMKGVVPEHQTELHTLTQHYVNVRYGMSVPTGDDIRQLTDNWHRIKKSRVKRQKEENNDVQGESENG